MNINIICVGKLKEKYLKDALAEYKKRIERYAKISIIEVADEKAPENLSRAEEEMVKRKEGERILGCLKGSQFVIALAIDGKMLDSVELSELINNTAVRGTSSFCFIIGGSLGLSDEVLKASDIKLSFSKMTFPHQLMRVILLEQIYRAFKISNNEPYHK